MGTICTIRTIPHYSALLPILFQYVATHGQAPDILDKNFLWGVHS